MTQEPAGQLRATATSVCTNFLQGKPFPISHPGIHFGKLYLALLKKLWTFFALLCYCHHHCGRERMFTLVHCRLGEEGQTCKIWFCRPEVPQGYWLGPIPPSLLITTFIVGRDDLEFLMKTERSLAVLPRGCTFAFSCLGGRMWLTRYCQVLFALFISEALVWFLFAGGCWMTLGRLGYAVMTTPCSWTPHRDVLNDSRFPEALENFQGTQPWKF